ncbi:MAG: acyl-CoA dehydrogenase family protein [Myxococcota bacterium]
MSIDFQLTGAQQQFREFIHQFAEHIVRPIALECDRTHQVPEDIIERVATMRAGMSMGEIPEEYGGDGAGAGAAKDKKGKRQQNRFAVLGAEEIAWGDVPFMMSLPGPGLGGPPVGVAGTPDQKQRFFGVLKQPGLHYGAYGLTEPGAGSDVAAIATTCVKSQGGWILNGTKCFISNGAKADWVIIFATVDRSLGRAGQRMFVVEKGTPGFSVTRIEEKMGLHAFETAELKLEDCFVGDDNLLGGEAHYQGKEGFMGAMKTFDSSRPLVAALALGIGRAAYEAARDYVKDNYLLARPIARYAVLADRLAEHARKLDAARLMTWRAAWMADEGIPNAKEASMCKAYAAQTAIAACRDAVQIMGAAGLDRERMVEKWYRDIKVFDIFEGTGQVQRIVISKRILTNPPPSF